MTRQSSNDSSGLSDMAGTTLNGRETHSGSVHAEGRIEPEDGTLMCSYHGWRFQGDGACTKVPQALDAKANAAACSNSRSCAVSHPTQVLFPCDRPRISWAWLVPAKRIARGGRTHLCFDSQLCSCEASLPA